jgi:group I intron endonuclease
MIYVIQCGVYKLKNKINGKVYIGVSTNIGLRYKKHQNACQDKTKAHYPIVQAIKKYGWNNFASEVIEEIPLNQFLAREAFWINYYNSTNPEKGYNLIKAGNVSKGFSPSLKTREKISKAITRWHQHHISPRKGVRPSPIAIKKLVAFNTSHAKPIYQIDMSSGKRIKIWESTKAAAISFGSIKCAANIRMVLRRKNKTAFGFGWEYA